MEFGSTWCYSMNMHGPDERSQRVFKTAWFSKAARKALIKDAELCAAIRQVMLGQADDLGGGVFKKRLGKNLYRSIIVAKGGKFWVYEYLFAKKDRDNIGDDELKAFRAVAGLYARKTDADIAKELQLEKIVEICHGEEKQIQERCL
ncbi:MAG: type II toxin-antitoxin system RelE/ParE family toxin [Terracidiphilus sp.]